uniref:Uncharacterized protein n=1 Tax=viral metagenome TaxID=1070528 RepID=A0A6M3J177_9ZZZZ
MIDDKKDSSLDELLKAIKGRQDNDVVFNRFTEGWIASVQPDLMPEGSLRVCRDLCFNEHGALSVPLEPTEVVGLTSSFYRAFFIAEAGSTTYYYRHVDNDGTDDKLQGSTDGVSWSDVVTLTSNEWEAVSYISCQAEAAANFYTYIACSSATKKILATTASPIGCTKPAAGPTVAVQGVGLTGVYKYVYTYYDSAVGDESEESDESTITLTNQGCRVTINTGGGGSNADQVKIYRTIAGGGSLYLVTTQAKSTATYDDTTADADLETYLDTKAIGAPPTGATILGNYLGRCWYLGFPAGGSVRTNKLYYSRLLKPGTVSVDSYVLVGNKEIPLTGFKPVFGTAFVFNRDTVYYLEGSTPNDFDAKETGSSVGTEATHSIDANSMGVFFVSRDGVYVHTNAGASRISEQINWVFSSVGDNLTPTIYKPYLNRCKGVIWDDQYWLILWTSSTERITLVYDIGKKIWRIRSVDLYCLFNDRTNDRLLVGVKNDTDDFRVHSLEASTRDIDINLSPYVITRETSFPDLSWLERYRVDAKGTWVLTFLVDDVPVFCTRWDTNFPTTLARKDVNEIRSIVHGASGRRLSIRIGAVDARPLDTRFYGVELLKR